VFALAYLDKNYSQFKNNYQATLTKLTKNLKDEYEYNEKFQSNANPLMGDILVAKVG
jgi:hypothetical protein